MSIQDLQIVSALALDNGSRPESQSYHTESGRNDTSFPLLQLEGKPWYPGLGGITSDQRPHVNLTIYLPPKNVQRLLVLMNTGAKSVLMYSNTDCFTGPTAYIKVYGSHCIMTSEGSGDFVYRVLSSKPV